MKDDIISLIERYRVGAIATGNVSDPKKANKGAAQLHACYKVLKESKEGRESLIALMSDAEPSVRCWSAAHCLQWSPDLARRVLETLRDLKGHFSFDAEMTLKEYENGRLTFDH
jgi:hypothetical protein